MYNELKKNELVEMFGKVADENLELVKAYGSLAESMRKDDADMVKYLVKEAVRVVASSVPSEVSVPDVAMYSSQNGDNSSITVIDLTLRNKYSAEYEFKFKKQIVYSEDVYEVLCDFIKCSFIELITDSLIKANLEEVNSMLAKVSKEAGNSFTVKIVSPIGGDGRKVKKVTDDEVIFAADESRILAMDDILLFFEPDEFVTEDKIKAAYNETVAHFAKAQTTPQFIGVHEPLIGYICDINKMVKPMTLIRKAYSKKVQNLRSNKETLAYYDVDGIFSVIAVSPEGKDVALSPFNTETLEVVDFDVLANI